MGASLAAGTGRRPVTILPASTFATRSPRPPRYTSSMLDKHLVPNLAAGAVALAGLALPAPAGPVVLSTGLFALSGALTNWLAVHMLFERVPGLYGSGVIALRFEELKAGLLGLVQEELFGEDKMERLFAASVASTAAVPAGGGPDGAGGAAPGAQAHGGSTEDGGALGSLLGSIDLDAAFDQLVATVRESSFGNMLQMVGGEAALEPLRGPFERRMRGFLADAARSPRVREALARQLSSEANRERFRARLESVLRARLDELTPETVKRLMHRLIRRHLGWLVVWGAVFGGAIGLVAGLLRLV